MTRRETILRVRHRALRVAGKRGNHMLPVMVLSPKELRRLLIERRIAVLRRPSRHTKIVLLERKAKRLFRRIRLLLVRWISGGQSKYYYG